jgi:hypothetical protein
MLDINLPHVTDKFTENIDHALGKLERIVNGPVGVVLAGAVAGAVVIWGAEKLKIGGCDGGWARREVGVVRGPRAQASSPIVLRSITRVLHQRLAPPPRSALRLRPLQCSARNPPPWVFHARVMCRLSRSRSAVPLAVAAATVATRACPPRRKATAGPGWGPSSRSSARPIRRGRRQHGSSESREPPPLVCKLARLLVCRAAGPHTTAHTTQTQHR